MARARTKGKDDAPEVICLVENGRLVPAYPHDAEVLASYSKGAKVFVSMRRQGKRRQHSIWYGLIGDMVKTGRSPWNNTKAADRACRMALDMIEPAKTVSGQWLSYDASLWDFTDEELDERIEMLRALFLQVTGLDPDDVRREFGGGKFDDGFNPPANDDAGDETLAGAAVPPTASEEDAGAGQGPSPVLSTGTGVTESQANASDDNGATAQAIAGTADSVTGDASRPSVGGGTDASNSPSDGAAPAPDDGGGAEPPAAPPPTELSAEERVWLKQGARMMLASLPSTDPESLRVLIIQANAIKQIAPKAPSDATLNRMQTIFLHCKSVCKGEAKLDKALVATTALASLDEVEPEPVKVRDQ